MDLVEYPAGALDEPPEGGSDGLVKLYLIQIDTALVSWVGSIQDARHDSGW